MKGQNTRKPRTRNQWKIRTTSRVFKEKLREAFQLEANYSMKIPKIPSVQRLAFSPEHLPPKNHHRRFFQSSGHPIPRLLETPSSFDLVDIDHSYWLPHWNVGSFRNEKAGQPQRMMAGKAMAFISPMGVFNFLEKRFRFQVFVLFVQLISEFKKITSTIFHIQLVEFYVDVASRSHLGRGWPLLKVIRGRYLRVSGPGNSRGVKVWILQYHPP